MMVPSERAASSAQLSASDASFLAQERDGAHMHIGSVSVFGGPAPPQEEVRAHILKRLGLAPRFRQRLAPVPYGLSRPWWVDDPDFNLDYHLRRTALPRPGGEPQLAALVGRIFSQRLDRGKPLWEMYLVEGVQEGRFALITKAHHALIDGISGVDLASVIMDSGSEVAEPGADVIELHRRPTPSGVELLAASFLRSARTPAALASYLAGAAMYPRRLTRTLETLGAATGALGAELLDPAPSLPLNGPIGPHRRFEWREFELERFRDAKQRWEATVNDTVLAATTGALRTWLQAQGVDVAGLEVRALVPVNLRTERDRGRFGNRVAMLRVALPVYERDPERRLTVVRDAMREAKRSRQLMAARAIIGLGEFAPPTILAQAARLSFSPRLFNLIVTNVPGPQTPLYLLGRRLEGVVPVAFLPHGHRVSIAVFSYAGRLTFGLLGDYDQMGDLPLMADALRDELERWPRLASRRRGALRAVGAASAVGRARAPRR